MNNSPTSFVPMTRIILIRQWIGNFRLQLAKTNVNKLVLITFITTKDQ